MKDINTVPLVIFTSDGMIAHMTAYPDLPTVQSLKGLFEELETDEEFGFGEHVNGLRVSIVSFGTFKARVGDEMDMDEMTKWITELVEEAEEDEQENDTGA